MPCKRIAGTFTASEPDGSELLAPLPGRFTPEETSDVPSGQETG